MQDPEVRAIPFTFTLCLDEDGWEGLEIACSGEAAAIAAAQAALQSQIDLRPLYAAAAKRGAVGVGMGSWPDDPDRLVWLGEWEWTAADGWCWTSSD
jgi:hypothetical protein